MPRSKFPIRRDSVYHVSGGGKYPSVTAITGSVPKPFLIPWAAKTAAAAVLDDPMKYDTAEKAVQAVTGVRDAAGERGKTLHALFEEWAKAGGKLPEGPMASQDDGYTRGFRTFIKAWNPTPLHAEIIVVNHTYKYAGRLDLIAQIGTEVWLADFKTGKSIYPEHGLQLSAYRNAEVYMRENDMTEYPMPHIDHSGIVLITGDGTFDFKTVEEPFEVFLAVKDVYNWSKRHA